MTQSNRKIGPQLAPHLPYLRRYARILTGSQASGDHFVRASLEAITEEDLRQEIPPSKLLLFMMFHRFWNPHRASIQDNHFPIPGLHAIGREALLLTAVEEFTAAEAGQILALGEETIEAVVQSAESTIAKAIRSNVLIIEDEPLIAMHLEQLVTNLGHEVTGNATTKQGAIALAKRSPPDLVLADIQLADGSSGVEAVNEILDLFDVPVVFVTAYPERLLTGSRSEPTYLVSKPFSPDALHATIGAALLQREISLSPSTMS